MEIAFIAVAIILAWGHVIAGRVIGMGITVVCGASMAYFVMPPVYSFRISRPPDLVVLVLYGTAGLLFTRKPLSAQHETVNPVPPVPRRDPGRIVSELTEVIEVIESIVASDVGSRLRAIGVEVSIDSGDCMIPCNHNEATRVLNAVLSQAIQGRDVLHISIYSAGRPGVRKVIVVAHSIWPGPLYKVVTIGKRDEDCNTASFFGIPSHSRVSWFDNGHDRVYQWTISRARIDLRTSGSTEHLQP